MFHATYDPEADAYYFRTEASTPPSVKQIDLGERTVVLDVDPYGKIIGIEVF